MNDLQTISKIKSQIETVFVGKSEAIDNMLITLLSEGHLLIEDVPGVGKTTLVIALAKTLNCDFGRIQCTPDTLPSDITGISIFDAKSGSFQFMEGSIMHQVVLVDEINRTSPKTQSALLEAMEERQISVEGKVIPMKEPFIVIATQNPADFLGTFPLPESQLDRFFMKMSIGYPSKENEMLLVKQHIKGVKAKQLEPIVDVGNILTMQNDVKQIHLQDDLISYILNIIEATRNEERFILGASERALLSLIRGTQACAYLNGRDYCIPDDVKRIVLSVLSHRLILHPDCRMKNIHSEDVLKENVLKVKVPILK